MRLAIVYRQVNVSSATGYQGVLVPADTERVVFVSVCVKVFLNDKLIFKPKPHPLSVMATCGNVVRENGTYFVSPKHPDYYEGTGSCQLTINKINPNICQLRLDFDSFMLAGPEAMNHVCNSDQFLVSGGSPVPTICGTNTGEHSKVDSIQEISYPGTIN